MQKLILVRHGQSEQHVKNLSERTIVTLNDTAHLQAAALIQAQGNGTRQ